MYAVKPLESGTIGDGHKYPSYEGVRIMVVMVDRNPQIRHLNVSVLIRCPSYGISVFRCFADIIENHSNCW